VLRRLRRRLTFIHPDRRKAQTSPIEEPPRAPASAQRFTLWQIGFRPLYLLASSFAALSIALWALQFAGSLGRPYLQGPLWHAHEMLFGFTLAELVGFLLTAGRNWLGRLTPSGWPLAAMAALWVAGRVFVPLRAVHAALLAGADAAAQRRASRLNISLAKL
jgi:uncharacterized protein involved in response to NO